MPLQSELNKVHWSCVIMDEAHRLKEPKAQVTKAAKALKTRIRYVTLASTERANRFPPLPLKTRTRYVTRAPTERANRAPPLPLKTRTRYVTRASTERANRSPPLPLKARTRYVTRASTESQSFPSPPPQDSHEVRHAGILREPIVSFPPPLAVHDRK